MKPIEFKGANTKYAEEQEEYQTLPAHRTKDGQVTTCWKLTLKERIKLLFKGRIYLQQSTFNLKLQPQAMLLSFNAEYWNQHSLTLENGMKFSVEHDRTHEEMLVCFERFKTMFENDEQNETTFVNYMRELGHNCRTVESEQVAGNAGD